MKGIVITTGNELCVQDFGEPLYQTIGKVVGGYIEVVHPKGLPEPYCMVVNEEGLLENLPANPMGCYLYQTHIHGCPIVGNLVIMKTGMTPDGMDIVGLSDLEISRLAETLLHCPWPVLRRKEATA